MRTAALNGPVRMDNRKGEKMFDFNDNRYTHMPFAAPDANGNPKEFCCIQNGGLWKIYHFTGQKWKRVKTGLPADATECSPTAEFEDGIWKISFVAGGWKTDRRFRLYRMYGLHSQPMIQTFADVGFVRKDQVCFGSRRGPVIIREAGRTVTLNFQNVAYLYRVSYDPFQPNRLLISGEYPGGEIFSWTYQPGMKLLKAVFADGVAAYKCAMYDGTCCYAGRTDGFEDRRIRKAQTLEFTGLPAEKYIIETEELTPNHANPEFE